MKKLLLYIAVLLIPSVVWAEVPENTQFKWSYSALADTIKEMRSNCEVTNTSSFEEIGAWARGKAMKFSLNELKSQCLANGPTKVERGIKDAKGKIKMCELPEGMRCSCIKSDADGNCIDVFCSQTQEYLLTDNVGCNIFLSTFFKKNNALRKLVSSLMYPGMYISDKSVSTGSGACYPIIDVVLAPGLESGNVNVDVNSNEDNIKIYMLESNSVGGYDVKQTTYKMWTNDMFLDVRNSMKKEGQVFGAVRGALFCPFVDLSDYVMSKYAEAMRQFFGKGEATDLATSLLVKSISGPAGSKVLGVFTPQGGSAGGAVLNAVESYDGGKYDIKTLARVYAGQTEAEAKDNGVLFMGKVTNYDWVGHFLFGMNWGGTIGVDLATFGADVAEYLSKGLDSIESAKQHMAYAMGAEYANKYFDIRKADNKTFIDAEYDSPEIATREIKKFYEKEIGCHSARCVASECGDDGNDMVICYGCSAMPKMYWVDDICD